MKNTNKDVTVPNPILEEIINDNSPIPEDDPNFEKPEEQDPNIEEPIDDTINDSEDNPPTPPAVVPKPVEEDTDKALKEQRREASLLAARNKKIADTIEAANNIPEPSLDEIKAQLKKEAPESEWEDLSPFEQLTFKKGFIQEKKLTMIQSINDEVRQIEKWADGVDKFIGSNETSQKFKKLIGNEEAFRKFAMMESHRGIPIETTLKEFLYDLPATPSRGGGALFPTGGGRAPEAPPSDIIKDVDRVRKLKLDDPREYARKIKAGKIQIDLD